jgi:D-glycero-alpha-D-manno-heptose-7-phosphate kinase
VKIIRAPLRVSLFGGGTDLDPFCTEHGSTIISFAIDRYMYLTWNDRPTGGCRLSYSVVEELGSLVDARHDLVREMAQTLGIREPCTLTIVSDLPKGTGLGSSSALAVCLAKLVWDHLAGSGLTHWASQIEHAVSRAGWQDYLPATYGGFCNYWLSAPDGLLTVTYGRVPDHLTDLINTHGLLLYTGKSRRADDLLPSWQQNEAQLTEIKLLADQVAARIDTLDLAALAEYLDQTWEMKREIGGVTDPTLNRQYAEAKLSGALAGKLCGAGAGGCWFFLVPPGKRERVRRALALREIPFQIAEKGVEAWEL